MCALRQLRASHLILGIDPVYSTWQAFDQALLVDSLLLSHIDVRHANFLPPRLTVGEAHDLYPYYTYSDKLTPTRDESTEQQQPPQAQAQTPPPPPPSHTRKRPLIAKQIPTGLGDAPNKTPRPSGGITIQEPTSQATLNMASTSQAPPTW